MLTWQADGGRGLEGTRLVLGAGGLRALGRMVRVHPEAEFTSSYRLVVGEDGTVQRVSVTCATAQRERHLTINRTEDGYWLLDTGAGGTRSELAHAVDVQLDHSPAFVALPVRRLGLHRTAGEHTLAVVRVSLPELEVSTLELTYRTVSVLDGSGHALVELTSAEESVELVVDEDGFVLSHPGHATRVRPGAVPAVT
jgi:hypothetical protein